MIASNPTPAGGHVQPSRKTVQSPVMTGAAPHGGDFDGVNVVQRLQQRIQAAKRIGFQVRTEVLGDNSPTWCEVAGKKMMFLDLAQTAGEQLQQLEDMLREFELQELALTSKNENSGSATTMTEN
ncbi:hypothetical protein [Stieleria varia]|uniref:Uncharacterized protein n=1 Tax=Stieleria varia TaxID=2528005 RepID=A0A5C6B3Z1_9BACT|nr:hypothetical protein [Stieleria varia]TWU06467.1 hypothetical protein Pla52n_21880 [Stieleria varia]